MTLATLRFLRELCNRVTLQVGDPNFRDDAEAILQALDELDHHIALLIKMDGAHALSK